MSELSTSNWRTRAYFTGGLVGAVLGLGVAYIYVNAAEKNGDARPELPPSEAVGIGLALLAVLRQIATMYEKDHKSNKKLA